MLEVRLNFNENKELLKSLRKALKPVQLAYIEVRDRSLIEDGKASAIVKEASENFSSMDDAEVEQVINEAWAKAEEIHEELKAAGKKRYDIQHEIRMVSGKMRRQHRRRKAA